jgi:hypothetical protein
VIVTGTGRTASGVAVDVVADALVVGSEATCLDGLGFSLTVLERTTSGAGRASAGPATATWAGGASASGCVFTTADTTRDDGWGASASAATTSIPITAMTAIAGPVVPGVCGGICAASDVGADTTHAPGANTSVVASAAAGASGGGSSSGRQNTCPQDSHLYWTMTGSPNSPATCVR